MGDKEGIVDRFGRQHNYLRLSLTERCNLRCFYCMPAEGVQLTPKPNLMTADEIIQLATMFVEMGVNKIRLTGGEPLVRKDAADIIERLGTLPAELAITTNGVIVDRFIDVFKRAGIRSVNVSLDSLDKEKQEKITRRNYFDKVMQNINLLVEHDFEVKINMVLMRDVNDNEVLDFIALTKELPVHVRFIEFMPFNGNSWDWSKGVSYAEVMDAVHTFYPKMKVQRLQDKPNDTARSYQVENYAGTFGMIASVSNPFCGTCNRIRVTADGKLKNCLFSHGETDLLTPMRNKYNIKPLIEHSILHKEEVRGGMKTMKQLSEVDRHNANRSMVMIGG